MARRRRFVWIIALAFGVAQLPWYGFVGIRVAEWHSGREVSFFRDTLLTGVELLFTVAAIATSAYGIAISGDRLGNWENLLFAIVAIVSFAVLTLAVIGWCGDVLFNMHGNWGQW